MKTTDVASGKCPIHGDQLLSVPGRTPESSRRVVCPICLANEREDLLERLRYIPTPEEVDRMSQ